VVLAAGLRHGREGLDARVAVSDGLGEFATLSPSADAFTGLRVPWPPPSCLVAVVAGPLLRMALFRWRRFPSLRSPISGRANGSNAAVAMPSRMRPVRLRLAPTVRCHRALGPTFTAAMVTTRAIDIAHHLLTRMRTMSRDTLELSR
jgi:hypothetical protein